MKKYRNQEVVESFVELLVFPEYVMNWTIRPVAYALLAFFIGFFVIDLVHIEYVIYAVVGLVLFLVTGLLLGLLFLTWKMKSDIWGIIDYSLQIMQSAIKDMDQVNDQVTTENRKDVMGLLFTGVIHIVTIPLLSQVISSKVPLVGGLLNRFIKKIFTLLSDRINFDEAELIRESKKQETDPNAAEDYAASLTKASAGLNKLMGITFGIAQLPLKIVFVISALLLVIFIYLIY